MEQHIEKLNRLLAKHSPDKEIQKEIYQDNNLFIIPEKVATAFIGNKLPHLLNGYTTYGTEKLYEYHIRSVIPQLHLNFASNLNLLEGEAVLSFEEEKMPCFEVLRSKNMY